MGGEGHTELEAEIGVLKPQAKDATFLEAWSHQKPEEAGGTLARACGRRVALPAS